MFDQLVPYSVLEQTRVVVVVVWVAIKVQDSDKLNVDGKEVATIIEHSRNSYRINSVARFCCGFVSFLTYKKTRGGGCNKNPHPGLCVQCECSCRSTTFLLKGFLTRKRRISSYSILQSD